MVGRHRCRKGDPHGPEYVLHRGVVVERCTGLLLFGGLRDVALESPAARGARCGGRITVDVGPLHWRGVEIERVLRGVC